MAASYWDMIKRLMKKVKTRQREIRVLNACQCIVRCPKCNEILNDIASYSLCSDGIVKYQCNKCQFRSVFNFDMAPVPVYIGEENINE